MPNMSLEVTYKNGKSMTYEGREMSLEEIDTVISYLDKIMITTTYSAAKLPLGPIVDKRCRNTVYLNGSEVAGINLSY